MELQFGATPAEASSLKVYTIVALAAGFFAGGKKYFWISQPIFTPLFSQLILSLIEHPARFQL